MADDKKTSDRFYEEILSKWNKEQEKCLEQSQTNLREMLSRRPEIASLEVQYNGSGDNGQVEDVAAYDDKNNRLPPDHELDAAAEELVYDLLGVHCPGWEINEGSSGRITIDAKTLKATIDHDWIVTMTESHEIEF
jgi:hypothetical protein